MAKFMKDGKWRELMLQIPEQPVFLHEACGPVAGKATEEATWKFLRRIPQDPFSDPNPSLEFRDRIFRAEAGSAGVAAIRSNLKHNGESGSSI